MKKDLLIQSLIYTINSYQRATTTLVVFYCGFNRLGRGARASSESQGWVGKGAGVQLERLKKQQKGPSTSGQLGAHWFPGSLTFEAFRAITHFKALGPL